jgi:type IV pilus assembly protein PilX
MTEKFAACSVAPSASETHCYETPPPPIQHPATPAGHSAADRLVLLLLSLTAVLGALRYSNLNEAMLGNTSDYNRTFAAAEALVRDAEIDIRGRRPPIPRQGRWYAGHPLPARSSLAPLTTEAGFQGCRNKALANTPFFPLESSDMDDLETIWQPIRRHPSLFGWHLCMPVNSTDLANFETNPCTYAAMIPLGATYGQFTRNGLTGFSSRSISTLH